MIWKMSADFSQLLRENLLPFFRKLLNFSSPHQRVFVVSLKVAKLHRSKLGQTNSHRDIHDLLTKKKNVCTRFCNNSYPAAAQGKSHVGGLFLLKAAAHSVQNIRTIKKTEDKMGR